MEEHSQKIMCTGIIGAIFAVFMFSTFTIVPEKHVGHLYRFKAMSNVTYHEPGLHFHRPWEVMNVTYWVTQTDHVTNITVVTADGIPVTFMLIQVVNRFAHPKYIKDVLLAYGADYDRPLIFDVIQNEVAEFASRLTLNEVYIERYHELNEILMARLKDKLARSNVTGLVIDEVRVKQPIIPEEIKNLHIEIQSKKTAILVANETKKVDLIQTETEREKAKIKSMQLKEVALMQAEQNREVQGVELRRLEDIALSEIKRAKERAEADATIVELQAKAQSTANQYILTPSVLRLHEIEAWGNSTKVIVYRDAEQQLGFPLSAVGL